MTRSLMGVATVYSRKPSNFVLSPLRTHFKCFAVFASARGSCNIPLSAYSSTWLEVFVQFASNSGVVDHGIDGYARTGLDGVTSSSFYVCTCAPCDRTSFLMNTPRVDKQCFCVYDLLMTRLPLLCLFSSAGVETPLDSTTVNPITPCICAQEINSCASRIITSQNYLTQYPMHPYRQIRYLRYGCRYRRRLEALEGEFFCWREFLCKYVSSQQYGLSTQEAPLYTESRTVSSSFLTDKS
ncbi:hypothetical protein GGR58DRAFT_319846 [Xylaria digitata]|nr:hypothetical protein GGR58DRAFT_319846 [Xylaria digitata]